jgi:hypothetical protein
LSELRQPPPPPPPTKTTNTGDVAIDTDCDDVYVFLKVRPEGIKFTGTPVATDAAATGTGNTD